MSLLIWLAPITNHRNMCHLTWSHFATRITGLYVVLSQWHNFLCVRCECVTCFWADPQIRRIFAVFPNKLYPLGHRFDRFRLKIANIFHGSVRASYNQCFYMFCLWELRWFHPFCVQIDFDDNKTQFDHCTTVEMAKFGIWPKYIARCVG